MSDPRRELMCETCDDLPTTAAEWPEYAKQRLALLERGVVDARRMVAVWKATIEMDSRDIERAAVELDVYEFRTLALSIVRRWLGKSKETIR